MKAMLFAAGLGTRLKPYTNDRPKALVPINGKPLLQIILEKLAQNNISEVIVNVHHFAQQLKDFIANCPVNIPISISDETGALLDTGGGLKFAEPLLRGQEPILIHNVDIISDINLLEMEQQHLTSGALATLAVSTRDGSRKFLFNDKDELVGWKNFESGEVRLARSNTYTPMSFSGVHIISPQLLSLIHETGRFSIIDVYLRLAQHHQLLAYRHSHKNWLDVGKPQNLIKGAALLDIMKQ